MIRILTDSASDILPAEAAQLGVDVIPLNVTLEDGTVIRDGVDLTPSEYYEHMAGCKKLPTTSQPSPELFEKFYAEAAAAGDEVVGIFLSHELSGTYQCAKLAADLANVDNVLFVDSANVCLGEGLLVRMAAHLRDEGRSAVQIAATLEHAKEHLHLVAAIDDLKYLRKGGRLPAAVAVAGGMLGIKPLITIKEGKVAMAGKARGLPGAYVALFKKIEELGGVDIAFGGIGITGHLAFNEPQPELTAEQFAQLPTRVLDIHPETRATNCVGDLGGALEDMPRKCVTIGMKEILGARKLRLGVFRDWHRAVCRRAAYGEVTAAFPATLAQNHPDALLYVNANAAQTAY